MSYLHELSDIARERGFRGAMIAEQNRHIDVLPLEKIDELERLDPKDPFYQEGGGWVEAEDSAVMFAADMEWWQKAEDEHYTDIAKDGGVVGIPADAHGMGAVERRLDSERSHFVGRKEAARTALIACIKATERVDQVLALMRRAKAAHCTQELKDQILFLNKREEILERWEAEQAPKKERQAQIDAFRALNVQMNEWAASVGYRVDIFGWELVEEEVRDQSWCVVRMTSEVGRICRGKEAKAGGNVIVMGERQLVSLMEGGANG